MLEQEIRIKEIQAERQAYIDNDCNGDGVNDRMRKMTAWGNELDELWDEIELIDEESF